MQKKKKKKKKKKIERTEIPMYINVEFDNPLSKSTDN